VFASDRGAAQIAALSLHFGSFQRTKRPLHSPLDRVLDRLFDRLRRLRVPADRTPPAEDDGEALTVQELLSQYLNMWSSPVLSLPPAEAVDSIAEPTHDAALLSGEDDLGLPLPPHTRPDARRPAPQPELTAFGVCIRLVCGLCLTCAPPRRI
jgi:hypothetical protein